MTDIKYSVVIPVYNSSKSLLELSARLHQVFTNQIKESFEIIFIDDDSKNPATWEILSGLAKEYHTVRVFKLAKNFGQSSALLCGMTMSRGQWIVTMDDDLQHRPEDILFLLAQKDHDVVIAKFIQKKTTFIKRIGSRLKTYLDKRLLGMPRHVVSSSFKLIQRRIVDELICIRTSRPFIGALLLSVTSDIVNVEVQHDVRRYGKSNYSLRKSVKLLLDIVFYNSSIVLKLMSAMGLIFSIISFVIGVILIIRKVLHPTVPQGWTSLMTIILFATGLILFCLGILGKCVFRLQETAELRKPFVIQKSIDMGEV